VVQLFSLAVDGVIYQNVVRPFKVAWWGSGEATLWSSFTLHGAKASHYGDLYCEE
jgi:hypothetical protein